MGSNLGHHFVLIALRLKKHAFYVKNVMQTAVLLRQTVL